MLYRAHFSFFPGIPVGDLRERATEKYSVIVLVIDTNGHWRRPTDLYAPEHGHDVAIADGRIRREGDLAFGVDSLIPVAPILCRIECRYRLVCKQIPFFFRVICGYPFVHSFMSAFTRQFKAQVLDLQAPKLGTSEMLKVDGQHADNQGIEKEARDCNVESKMLVNLSSTHQIAYGFR
jgi:hypothetical protein